MSGTQEVGVGTGPAQVQHALLWSGTAASAVDLNPANFVQSQANGVSGGQQVGFGYLNFNPNAPYHALLWNGTAANAIDLHPAGFLYSEADGTNGTQQIGEAVIASSLINHAIVWSGTAGSAVDLQAFTPASFSNSAAQSIDSNGDVLGLAFNSFAAQHLVEWIPSSPAPEPSVAWVLGCAGAGLLVRRPHHANPD